MIFTINDLSSSFTLCGRRTAAHTRILFKFITFADGKPQNGTIFPVFRFFWKKCLKNRVKYRFFAQRVRRGSVRKTGLLQGGEQQRDKHQLRCDARHGGEQRPGQKGAEGEAAAVWGSDFIY